MNATHSPDTMFELLKTTLRFEYVRGGVTKIKPLYATGWRTVPEAVCAFISDGEARLETTNEPPQHMRPGEAFLMPAGVRHCVTSTANTVYTSRWAHFRITLFNTVDVFRFFMPPRIWRGATAAEMGAVCAELAELRTRMMTSNDASLRLLARCKHLEFKLVDLIAEGSAPCDGANRLLDQLHRLAPVLARLDKDQETSLTLGDMAKLAGLSPSRFSALFQEALDTSPAHYQGQQQFNRIVPQLMHTGKLIAQIAQEAGFSNESKFSKAFKRITGVSPRAYRTQRRHDVW